MNKTLTSIFLFLSMTMAAPAATVWTASTNWVGANFYLKSNPSNYVTTTITNGLASQAYAESLTNGFVGLEVTNGLASEAYAQSLTNGFVDSSVTNGLATMAYAEGLTNGFVDASVTNGLGGPQTNISYTAVTNAPWSTITNSEFVVADDSFFTVRRPNGDTIISASTNGFTVDVPQQITTAEVVSGQFALERMPSLVITQGHSVAVTVSNSVSINGTNYIYRASPPANELLFTIATSDDAKRFSVDEDGDVVADGAITSSAGGDWSLGSSSAFARLKNLYIEPSGSATSSRYWFKSDANADLATIRSSNAVFSGTLTATNGVYVVAPTNVMAEGVGITNITAKITPVGMFGYMGFVGSEAIDFVDQNVYTNIVLAASTNYTRVLTNGFGYNAAGGLLTNEVAGYYGIHFGMVFDGDANISGDELEAEVFINGTAEEYIASHCSGTGLNSNFRINHGGTVYLQANSTIELKIKNTDVAVNPATMIRAYLKVGTP